MHLKLRHKINGAIVITFILIACLFTVIQIRLQQHRLAIAIDNIETLLQTLVERDTEQLANEIFDDRKKAIGIRLEEMRKVEGIISISVFNHEGVLLTSVGKTRDHQNLTANEVESIRQQSQIRKGTWEGYGSLLFSKAIGFLGQQLGCIRIHYALKKIEADIHASYIIFAGLLATTFVLMLVILNLILSKTILGPILYLKKETQLIVKGDYEHEIHSRQNDEIGNLAIGFETMRIAIKEKIFDLEQTKESLRRREERLRLITDNMVDTISQTDAQMNFVYVSPSINRVFGYDANTLIGKPAMDYVHPDDAEELLGGASDARKNRRSSIIVRHRFKHANGPYKWVESATRLLYDVHGQSNGAIFGTRDIDRQVQVEKESKKLEKQLMQTQKLEAIGHLAGGVAHDLNNLLSPILGYAELLLGEETISTPHKNKLEQIHKAGLGARDLVRQLLAFGRKQTLEYKPVDINKTVKGFEKLIRRTIPEDIELEIIASNGIKPVMADVGQIEQVIMNLSINAADAMQSGGRLTIETDLVDLDETYVSSHSAVKAGSHVMLGFSDTGSGMDKETQEKIFEPFYSTKGQKGTGLGLATVYGIIKQHDGNIWVYSEPGKGTTIKIYLPVDENVDVAQTATRIEPVSFHGSETILLVEDNQEVRTLAQTILEQQGYRVLEAADGLEAIKIIDNSVDNVHLLLADVVLPNMNGKEVYEVAIKKYPSLQVLYMSGYTDNVIAHRGVLDEGINFIQKPFSVHRLGSKVRDVLDRANSGQAPRDRTNPDVRVDGVEHPD